MVDDEELRGGRPAARSLIEAVLEVRAARPEADVGVAAHLLPGLVGRREREVGQGAVLGALHPLQERPHLVGAIVLEERRLGLGREQRPPDRDVVAAPLDERPAHVADQLADEREVLAGELLLKVDRVGGQDGPLSVLLGPARCGQEVGQGLSRTGPGLYDRDAALVEALDDALEHRSLPGPVLVPSEAARELPTGREHAVELGPVQADAHAGQRWLHHDVQARRVVVDDRGPQPSLVEASRHGEIRLGGLERAVRMVVQHHPALRGVAGGHQHGLEVPAGDRARVVDDPGFVHGRQEADLPPPRTPDLVPDPGRGARRQGQRGRRSSRSFASRLPSRGRLAVAFLEPVQAREGLLRKPHRKTLGDQAAQVLSFFFFAAGKRTLFRMRRYPGELGWRARSVWGSPIWCSASSGSWPPK